MSETQTAVDTAITNLVAAIKGQIAEVAQNGSEADLFRLIAYRTRVEALALNWGAGSPPDGVKVPNASGGTGRGRGRPRKNAVVSSASDAVEGEVTAQEVMEGGEAPAEGQVEIDAPATSSGRGRRNS